MDGAPEASRDGFTAVLRKASRPLPSGVVPVSHAVDCEAHQEQEGQGEDRPVADARIGREAGARLDGVLQDAGPELRDGGDDGAVGADHPGDAVARRAHQEAPGLERTEARHLQLLVRRGGIDEPGVVRDVDEQRRSRKARELVGAVGVLVADRRCEPLAAGLEQRLVLLARGHVVVRQVLQSHPLAHCLGYREELAERHEAPLVVPAVPGAAHGIEPVADLARLHVEVEEPEHHVGSARGRLAADCLEVGDGLVREHGHCRLRPDDDLRAERLAVEVTVLLQRRRAILDEPLLILRDRTLQERDVDGLTRRTGPLAPVEQPAAQPQRAGERDRGDPAGAALEVDHDDRTGDHRDREGNEVDAADGRERREGRIALRIAELEPRESREQPAAQPLHQGPAGGDQEQRARGRRVRRDARDDVGEKRVVGALDREQRADDEEREPCRRLPEHVDGSEDPPGARAEQRGAEPEAGTRRLPRLLVLPEQEQERRPDPGEEVESVRGEGEGRAHAGDHRDQPAVAEQPRDGAVGRRHQATRPSPPAAGRGPGVVTRSWSMRRRSARSTLNSSPSMVTDSPRRGSRPNWCITSPPIVSYSSSLKRVPKYALNSCTRVSASTANWRSPSVRMVWSSSVSYSSAISPTISSITSSIVTRPDTPPYSSTTIAMWLRLARNSFRSTLSRLLSGTKAAGRSTSRMSKLPVAPSAK